MVYDRRVFGSVVLIGDITHSFTSLSQAAREAADSRVYAGIHFRSACGDGLILGRKVAERTVALYLQPVKK
jgi:hypothetical protein